VQGASGSPALKMRTSADSWQAERARLERCCSASSAHGTARTEAQRLGFLTCLANSNFKRNFECPCRGPPAMLLRKCKSLQIARSQHLHMALLAQRHRHWGHLLLLPPQNSNVDFVVRAGVLWHPTLKMRTSADRWQAERASLESCCSASYAHGTACTEAQRLGLLTCLANSNFKRSFGGPCRGPPVALLRKCERLQIAHSQTEPAWKDVAQPHLPMALLAQRHRDWGCLLVLPNQSSKVS